MTFLGEIKRRKVFHVAVVYAVVAWALVEIVATVEEPLGLPGWVDTLVIVLVGTLGLLRLSNRELPDIRRVGENRKAARVRRPPI